jgi:hypothetical protein
LHQNTVLCRYTGHTQHCPFSHVTQMKLTAIIHTCICVYLTSLLCDLPGECIQTDMGLCNVSYWMKMCRKNSLRIVH